MPATLNRQTVSELVAIARREAPPADLDVLAAALGEVAATPAGVVGAMRAMAADLERYYEERAASTVGALPTRTAREPGVARSVRDLQRVWPTVAETIREAQSRSDSLVAWLARQARDGKARQ